MRVYLDLVMGLNFVVDLLLILGTNRLSGFPPCFLRSAGAAAMGAAYAVACMLPRLMFLGNGLWRLAFLVLMGLVAFGINSSAWRRTGIFILLSMALGGVALGMGRAEFPILILSVLCVWFLCRVGFGGQVVGKEYVPVQVECNGRCAAAIALKDTGNSLRDPITGEQVLVLGPEAAERLLDLSRAELEDPTQTLTTRPGQGLRLIPYTTVGCGGMLLAKRFENVTIGECRGRVLVAFAPERIGAGETYQALTGGMI